jgi:hypothetical protein
MRATFNKDIKSGNFEVDDDYATVGPTSIFHIKNKAPELECYILHPETCTEEQYAQVLDGAVLIKDFVVVVYDVEVKIVEEIEFAESFEGQGQEFLGQIEL